jgi:hypothetical protein
MLGGSGAVDAQLKAYCDFSADFGEYGRCRIDGRGRDGRLTSDFEDVATQAAYALGCPQGVDPLGFWLFKLGQDLLKSLNPAIRAEFSPGGEWGGWIQGLLESSAGYCSRLAARAVRQESGAQETPSAAASLDPAAEPKLKTVDFPAAAECMDIGTRRRLENDEDRHPISKAAEQDLPAPNMTSSSVNSASAPEGRLSDFLSRHAGATYADVRYTARVHKPDFQDWRNNQLSPASIMAKRIEDVLSGVTPLKKNPGKRTPT